MPPPGGSPGMSSAARNLITYSRSMSSSLDLSIWIISVKIVKFYGYIKGGNSSGSMFSLKWLTFHFHIDLLLHLCLPLQCLLWHLGGAREADNDDADVIQAALQRETDWIPVKNNKADGWWIRLSAGCTAPGHYYVTWMHIFILTAQKLLYLCYQPEKKHICCDNYHPVM